MAAKDTYAHWRDSARTPLLFFVDARGAFALLLFLFHPHWSTIGIALGILIFLGILNYFNIPLTVFMRLIRGALSGPKKHIRL